MSAPADAATENRTDPRMIINTFSYLWRTSAIDAITELVEHGYRTFEVPISSPHCWPVELSATQRSTIRTRLEQHGATIRSLNAGGYDLNIASPAASMRSKSIEHISTVIDLAAEWGVREVVISPGTRRPMISPPIEDVHGWMHESIAELIPLAERAGTRLLFENTPYCFVPTIGELVDVVRIIDHEAVKIVYDVANAAYIGEDTVAAVLEHHASFALMHISDTGTDVWGHDPIGTGVIDWRGLGEAVGSTIGVDNVVLEIIREEDTLREFATAMKDLRAEGWSLGS